MGRRMKAVSDSVRNVELIEFLSHVDPFTDLNESELQVLSGEFGALRLKNGEALIQQGGFGDGCYVLRRGKLRICQKGDNGEEITISFVEPGVSVGEIGFYTGERRSASVYAVGDCEVLVLHKSGIEKLGAKSAKLISHFSKVIADRLQRSELRNILFVSDFFREMGDAAKRDLEGELELVVCPSGEFLIRKGERNAHIYLVISGRLSVTDGNSGERMLCELGRGQTVGEIAMLTGKKRTATVRAIRDSLLARLSPEAFHRLLQRHPEDMVRQFAGKPMTQLQVQTLGKTRPRNVFVNLAIIPITPDAPVTRFARKLAETLSSTAPTLHLNQHLLDEYLSPAGIAQTPMDDPNSINIARWLNQQELRFRYILYEADATNTQWTNRCLRQADRILLVGNSDSSPQPGEVERRIAENPAYRRHLPKNLVLLHRSLPCTGTWDWLALRDVQNHYHVVFDDTNDFERIARLITGQGVGLVISGGGARGFAHIGGIRALREAGIPIDKIGGTSMGSIIAAMVALGWDYETMIEQALSFNYKLDYTFPAVSLTAGSNITKALRDGLGGSRIEDLRLTFFCITTDLRSCDQKVHRSGPLWKYVRASTSIPGLFPPVVENGSVLVDGGIINNMPVDVMKSSDDIGRVIAFDVSRSAALQSRIAIDGSLSGWKVFAQRCNPFKKEAADFPRLAHTLIQASLTKSAETTRTTKQLADYYIQFPVQQYGLLAFNEIADIAEAGYVCANAKVDEWRHSDFCDLPMPG